MTDRQYDQLMKKLDMILKILSIQVLPEGSITEKVRILTSIGLTHAQISDILNIPVTSVRTLSSRIKKMK